MVDQLGHPVNCVSLSNDTNCVLASCLDSTLRLLDRYIYKILWLLQSWDTVYDCFYKGLLILQVLWRTSTGVQRAQLQGWDYILFLNFSPIHLLLQHFTFVLFFFPFWLLSCQVSSLDSVHLQQLGCLFVYSLLLIYFHYPVQSFKMDCCFTNTDAHVTSGSEDGYIFFWDLVDASIISKFRAHASVVSTTNKKNKFAGILYSLKLNPIVLFLNLPHTVIA